MQPENKSNHKSKKQRKKQPQNANRKTKAIIKAQTNALASKNGQQHSMFATSRRIIPVPLQQSGCQPVDKRELPTKQAKKEKHQE